MCLIAYSNEPVRHRPANPTKKKETSHPLFSFLVWPVCFFLYLFDL